MARRTPKKGRTVLGSCPDPRFAGVLWADDIDWTPVVSSRTGEEVAAELAGKLPPAMIQAVARCFQDGEKVEAWRLIRGQEHGRTGQPSGIDWKLVPLGEVPDIEIARTLGIKKHKVTWARERSGIQSPGADKIEKWATIDWPAQFNGRSDMEIATTLQVCPSLVCQERNRLGLRPAPSASKKNINWDNQPLGKMKDTELAEILGVTYPAVQYARTKRGIPPFDRKKVHNPPAIEREKATDNDR